MRSIGRGIHPHKHQIMGPWGFWDRPRIVQYSVRLKKEAVPVHGRLVGRGGVRREPCDASCGLCRTNRPCLGVGGGGPVDSVPLCTARHPPTPWSKSSY